KALLDVGALARQLRVHPRHQAIFNALPIGGEGVLPSLTARDVAGVAERALRMPVVAEARLDRPAGVVAGRSPGHTHDAGGVAAARRAGASLERGVKQTGDAGRL